MTVEELLHLDTEVAMTVFFGGVFFALIFHLICCLLHDISGLFNHYTVSTKCHGFMTGQIKGKCHCSSCYHRKDCIHYEKFSWVAWIKKNKPHF